MTVPFWKSTLAEIEEAMAAVNAGQAANAAKPANAAQPGKAGVFATSAGGRDIWLAEYGAKQDFGRRANYNSACGAQDEGHYARKGADAKPVLLLVGGVHGGELEGIVGVMNLIRLLETGADYRGRRNDYIFDNARRFRLLLIPCMNPDGRARLPAEWMIDMPYELFVRYMQGTWKDGSLCGWPACKAVHPIKEASEFLGTYFNDDGVNFMHDNFFAPMARETRALLDLADREAVDFHVTLHGGADTPIHFPRIPYLPRLIQERQQAFNLRMEAACSERGLPFSLVDQAGSDGEKHPFPSFNLTAAVHHACGGMSMTFESNMGLDAPGTKLTPDEILDSHFALFEEMMRFFADES